MSFKCCPIASVDLSSSSVEVEVKVKAKAKSVLMMVLGYRSGRGEVLMLALLETQRSQ